MTSLAAMRVVDEIEGAKVKLFKQFTREILVDVRRLEVELEQLRVSNAKALELITRGERVEEVPEDLTMVGCRWLESYCLMNIIALERRVSDLRDDVKRKEEVLERHVPSAILQERNSLAKENKQLKEAKMTLQQEFVDLQEQNEREKVEMRTKIVKMKTNRS